ncbi:MAG: PAS domain S-box protein, partial [Thermoplasmatota archaeon]
QLKQSEQKYRELLEHANSVILKMDTDGNVTYFNEFAEQFFGWSEEEILGKNVVGTIVPETELSGRELASIVDDIISSPDEYVTNENENTRRNGDIVWIAWTNKVIYNDDGEVDEILCIGTDITERKQMEEELRAREKRYRDTVDLLPMPYGEFKPDGTAVLINQTCLELFQYTKQEFEEGLTVMQVLHPDDRERAGGNIKKVLQGEETAGFEYRFIKKDGTTFPCLVYSKPLRQDGDITGFKSMLLDISEQKKLEQELRESKEKYATLVEQGNDGIMIVQDHLLKYCNKKLLELTGYTMEEVQDTPFLKYMGPAFAAVAKERYEKRMAGEEVPRVYETEILSKDGRSIPVEVNASTIEYEEKPADMAIVRDITERKWMEQQFKEQQTIAQTLLDATHDAALLADVDGTILAVNEAMAEAMNDDREAIRGSHMIDQIGREAYARRTPKVREMQRTKQPVQFVDEREGRIFSQRFYPVFDEDGEVQQVAVFSQDITERKQMEQELRESEERYRRLIEASPDSIIHVGLDGRILTANEKAAHIHGFASPEDMVGRDAFSYVAEADRQRARENMQRVLEDGLIENIPYTFLREDGTPFLAELSVATIYDDEGNPTAFAGVTRDVTEQKKMKQELQESEEKFRRLAEQSFDGIFSMDWRGVFTYVSPAVRRIAGYEPEEVEGTFFGRYIRKRDLPRLLKAVVDLKRGYSIEALRYGLKRKDGTVAIVEINATPVIRDGKSVGIQGNIRDVTERQQAEERYRRLIEASPELIAEADEEGRFVTVNPAMARALGYRLEELVGRPASEVLPEDIFQQRMAALREAIKHDTIVEMTDERGGRLYQNIVIPLEVPGGGHHVQLIARDITQRKKTEQALRESEEKFRSIFTHAPIGIALVDVEGRAVISNPAFQDMLGYSEQELASMRFPEFTHPDDVDKDLEMYWEVQEGKRDEYTMGKRYIAKDGSVVWANLTMSVVRGEDGEPLWGVGLVEDITERKQVEEERQRQAQLAALGRIAAVVSHELNTPLANIALAADCLASECALEPCEELEVIHREVDNASAIVKQVLGFSRLDEMDLQPIDLASVVTEVVDAVRDTTPIKVAIEVSVAAAGVMADEHQLYRAFVNLVKNAVLARDPDKESHHVTITSETTGSKVVVTIADTGVGMDSEIQAQADTPFFTTRPPGEGTGLGLYIARWIIERQGGTIDIESEPGQGTMVTVTLPLREEQA